MKRGEDTARGCGNPSCIDHGVDRHHASATRSGPDALRDIYDLAWIQYVEWMHFHEVAMADPFKAEAEAQAFCREVIKAALAAGIERGHSVGPTRTAGEPE